MGAHTIGSCHKSRSGHEGHWTGRGCGQAKFDNEYFRNLVTEEWTPKQWDGPLQYENAAGNLMMLHTDVVLKTDNNFRELVEEFAGDQDSFFCAFAAAFSKLLHQGCTRKPKGDGDHEPSAKLAQLSAARRKDQEFRDHAMHGNLDGVRALAGVADVHSRDPVTGRTALHFASFWQHTEVVAALVAMGLSATAQDKAGDTPLHDAARLGHLDVVQVGG